MLHFVLYFVCFDALPCLILCLHAFYCVRVACLGVCEFFLIVAM